MTMKRSEEIKQELESLKTKVKQFEEAYKTALVFEEEEENLKEQEKERFFQQLREIDPDFKKIKEYLVIENNISAAINYEEEIELNGQLKICLDETQLICENAYDIVSR